MLRSRRKEGRDFGISNLIQSTGHSPQYEVVTFLRDPFYVMWAVPTPYDFDLPMIRPQSQALETYQPIISHQPRQWLGLGLHGEQSPAWIWEFHVKI